MKRGMVLTAGVVALSLAGAAVAAAAAGVGALSQVSNASPFAGCTADNVAGQSGDLHLDGEVEPWVAVDPTDSQRLLGGWQQDRWSNGGARGNLAAVSEDGGATWDSVVVPGVSLCSGGDLQRATDPWVTFSPNGHAYFFTLSFNDSDFDHALYVNKSTDGGRTWGPPTTIVRENHGAIFNDKNSITADPYDSRFVYAVWDRLQFPNARAHDIAGLNSFGGKGPTWFARTTDGGATWEPARQIFDPGQEAQTIGNQIVVLPSGELVNVFDLIYYARNNKGIRGLNVAVQRSVDKGATWSGATIVSKLGTIGITDPESGAPVRTGDIIPEAAVDPITGRVYVVWQDAGPNGGSADAIVLSTSDDGGRTWTAPVKVNRTPTTIPDGNQQAFTPSVEVNSDGVVAVTYYDFRNNDGDTDLKTDYWLVHCHPVGGVTCTSGEDYGDEVRLTDASFDMTQAPFARGYFTGDYQGLASGGTDFSVFFSQPSSGDPANVFARRVTP